MKKIKLLAVALLILLFTACSVAVSPAKPNETNNKSSLEVSIIDVGQGDSALIKTPGNKYVLVDAASKTDKDKLFNYLKTQNISSFYAVVGTHPHEDHIGNLDDVINSYQVDKVYLPKVTSNTKAFENLMEAIKKKNLKINTAKGGVDFEIDGVKFSFLSPNNTSYEEVNNYSSALKITYNNTSFLLMGDAEKLSENEILAKGYNLKADVIKLGHHGSYSSSGSSFIKAVNPKYAAISCGKANDYGHPHKETLDLMKKLNIDVYRTDLMGTISFISDGNIVKLVKK